MGALTALQAQNIAADEGLIPKEFVPDDATAGGMLSDDEKPIEVETTSVLQQARERMQMTATPMPQAKSAYNAENAFKVLKGAIAMPDDELQGALNVLYADRSNPRWYKLVEQIDSRIQGASIKAATIDSEWDAALKWVDESQAEEQSDE
jgi:hypothetical protein